ncbi:MAG: CoA transferase [Burkholderiales bacterium]|nr:CoA transferase [Burkholderiales bacterium]
MSPKDRLEGEFACARQEAGAMSAPHRTERESLAASRLGKPQDEHARPLEGVRVIDASHVFAIPYATGLLCDLGAEVIKIQAHTRVDVMAAHGPFPENAPGDRPWDRVGSLNTVNRGKRGLALDFTKPAGVEIFRRLAAVSDVVAESFTPRVLKNLGLDYASLRALKPDLVMLSNTGYGHTGPWREWGSVATSLEATSGMCWLSGYEDGAPSKIGQSYTDFLACWSAVYAILASLYRRRRSGRGQWIDLSMYQAGAATIGPLIMDYMANGRIAARIGNRHETMAPHGVYPRAGEDRWIAIAVGSDVDWQALRRVMGDPAWARESCFEDMPGRLAHRQALDRALGGWTAGRDAAALAALLQAAGVMAGVVENGRDLLHDEQLRSRGFFERVAHPPQSGIGTRRYMGRPWRLSATPLSIAGPAPRLGEHNREILTGLLGYSPGEVDALEHEGVIGCEITSARSIQPLPLAGMRRNRRIGAQADPDYRDL